MKLNSLLSVLACAIVLLCTSCSSGVQSEKHYQLIPSTGSYYATLTSYMSSTGKMEQHYMKDGAWIKNENIPSPAITINGGNYGMKFISETSLSLPSLFVYSKTSGEFEFFFLENGKWNSSNLIPKGKVDIGTSNLSLDWIQGTGRQESYIEAYAKSGQNFGVFHVDPTSKQWKRTLSFPN